MKIIEMKLPIEYFKKDRHNRLEARLAKFDLKKGNIIRFREWDTKRKIFTGRFFDKRVVDLHKIRRATRFWSKKDLLKFGIYVLELADKRTSKKSVADVWKK